MGLVIAPHGRLDIDYEPRLPLLAPLRHFDGQRNSLLIGAIRKSSAHGQMMRLTQKRDVGRAADSGSRFRTRRPDPPCGAICYSAVEVVRALAELGLVQSQCGPLRFEASSLFGNRAVGRIYFIFVSAAI